jgi:hypothetical protein
VPAVLAGVLPKDEFEFLLDHLYSPLGPFKLAYKFKTELLIEMTSDMKALKSPEINPCIASLSAKGDRFLHKSTAHTTTPHLL